MASSRALLLVVLAALLLIGSSAAARASTILEEAVVGGVSESTLSSSESTTMVESSEPLPTTGESAGQVKPGDTGVTKAATDTDASSPSTKDVTPLVGNISSSAQKPASSGGSATASANVGTGVTSGGTDMDFTSNAAADTKALVTTPVATTVKELQNQQQQALSGGAPLKNASATASAEMTEDEDRGLKMLGYDGNTGATTDMDMRHVSTSQPASPTSPNKVSVATQEEVSDSLSQPGVTKQDQEYQGKIDAIKKASQDLANTPTAGDDALHSSPVVSKEEEARQQKKLAEALKGDSTSVSVGEGMEIDPRSGDDPSAMNEASESAIAEHWAQDKKIINLVMAPAIDGPQDRVVPSYQGGPAPELPGSPPHHALEGLHEYGGFEYHGRVKEAQLKELGFKGKCISWGNPASILSFDGRSFSFQGRGSFILYKANVNDEEERIDIRQFREERRGISHNIAAAFRLGDNKTVEIRLVQDAQMVGHGVRPEILLNGKDITAMAGAERLIKERGFRILRDGAIGQMSRLVLAIQSQVSGTTMAVSFRSIAGVHHLNVFIEVDTLLLGQTEGICGLFDLNPANDLDSPGFVNAGNLATDPSAVNRAAVALATYYHVSSSDESLFLNSTDSSLGAVASDPVTPASLLATEAIYEEAEGMCKAASMDFQSPCTMNALVGGQLGAEESAAVEELAFQHSVKVDSGVADCLASDYNITHWSEWSHCNVKCGPGQSSRERVVSRTTVEDDGYGGSVTKKIDCGAITQYRLCANQCEKPNVWGKCAAFGDVHYVTFDSLLYDFHGIGEFVLYNTLDNREQINILQDRPLNKSSPYVSYATGASFRFGPDVFSIQVVSPNTEVVSVRYNGRQVRLSSNFTYLGMFRTRSFGKVAQLPTERHTLIVEAKIPGGTTLTAAVVNFGGVDHLNVYLEIPGERSHETRGLCGTWDFNRDNDLTDYYGHALNNSQVFGWNWRVSDRLSLFTDAIPAPQAPVNFTIVTPKLLAENETRYHWAIDTCIDVAAAFRESCMIDVLATDESAKGDFDGAARIVNSNKIDVESNAVGCLSKPGSKLGKWSDWSTCSASCGPDGTQIRTRQIFASDGSECGALSSVRTCNNEPCPVPCVVTEWSNFTDCSVTCNNGTEYRIRVVLQQPKFGGTPCPPLREERECVQPVCCEVGVWTPWSDCENGYQERSRPVNAKRCGHSVERRTCCTAGEWTPWSECENGLQNRTRDTMPFHCAGWIEKRECCSIGDWGAWGECINGEKRRNRRVMPDNCAQTYQIVDCCALGPWGNWSTCDQGAQRRTRDSNPLNCDATEEFRPCCWTSAWSDWTNCTDDGLQWHSRTVLGDKSCPTDDPFCCGETNQTRPCVPPPHVDQNTPYEAHTSNTVIKVVNKSLQVVNATVATNNKTITVMNGEVVKVAERVPPPPAPIPVVPPPKPPTPPPPPPPPPPKKKEKRMVKPQMIGSESACACCTVVPAVEECPCSCRPQGANFYISHARPRLTLLQQQDSSGARKRLQPVSLIPVVSPVIDGDSSGNAPIVSGGDEEGVTILTRT